ncbi:nuclear transport factor 2 family protein [Rhodococcus ruber]|uniref:Nuclear transport factor 2 family protein n=1 Tax=Rhodococcus ruber TaxID=1830 RepID=A0ABT4MET6_9NOCA|nr:nuclear transport factor 2 family protein [Rhodococcus ruber]MCZ4519477.1 nuclear transport factor 2 family protein [Rhodococcus ruber]
MTSTKVESSSGNTEEDAMSTSGYNAIANILARYAQRIDAADFDGVGDLFAKAVVEMDGPEGRVRLEGADAVSGFFRASARVYEDGSTHTRHVITNLIIDVDEDAGTGSSSSSAVVLQAVEGVIALQPILVGSYDDTFERVGTEWSISSRFLSIDLMGDVSKHLQV